MNAPPGPLSNEDITHAHREMRAERLPARKRDRLIPLVRSARKRLTQGPPGALAKLR
ncbi:MAG: hypothetical protein ACTHN7_07005 [Solirubrobacterales bacterium]